MPMLNLTGLGTQHRLGPAALRHDAHAVRPPSAESGRHGALCRVGSSASAIEKLIDDRDAGGLLRERRQSRRQHLRHRSAGPRGAQARRAADRRQHRGHADSAAADRLRRRHRRALADEVHGRPRHDARRRHRRQRPVSLESSTRDRFPMFSQPDPSYHDLVYTEHFKEAAYIGRCRSVYQRTTGAVLSPLNAFLLLQGIETVALRVERHVENGRRVAEFLRSRSAGGVGQLRRVRRQPLLRAGAEVSRRPGLLAHDLRRHGRLRGRQDGSTTRSSWSSGWSIWATPSRWPAIRPRPPIGRCRPKSSARPASRRR